MSMVRLKNLTVRYEQQQVVREVFLRVASGERVALMGANGSGKSSLLRLIVRTALANGQGTASTHLPEGGAVPEVDGAVELDAGIRVGYFSQFSRLDDERSIEEVLLDAFSEVRSWERRLTAIEAALCEPDADYDTLLTEQADLLEKMDHADGWNYVLRIDTVLSKLGFSAEHRQRPIGHLSGGWRNRASLALVLLEVPDLLLLDEPTNYLDIDGIAWLEQWLARLAGATLVVSHDRQFLDSITNRMVEVQNYRLHEYSGNYAAYVWEKTKAAKTLEKEFRHEEELLAFETSALAARKKARQGGGRGGGRCVVGGETPLVDRVVSAVYENLHIPDLLLDVQGVSVSRGDRVLVRDLSFSLAKGDRLVILGRNGCGKSSLLQTLMGTAKASSGTVSWKPGVRFADFVQTVDDLDPTERVHHCAMRAPQQFLPPHEMPTQKSVLKFMQMLGFTEPEMQLRVGALSGGQRARLALAWCLTSGPAVMVLDEPTNHLDLRSAQIMERALAMFPGAVLAVSHDRMFVDKVANRILAATDAGWVLHEGGWSDWVATQ